MVLEKGCRALLTTAQSIMNEVDKGKCVKAMVLDLAEAFDKVPHRLLLRKMEAYGFSMATLSWIQQILTEKR